MADISTLMPVVVAAGTMFFVMLGLAALFKSFYKKVPAGEVMIVNTMASEPLIVRSGALVYPIIYSSANISLNAVPVEIESDLSELIKEKYKLNLSSLSVQVIDSKDTIIRALDRVSVSDEITKSNQLQSIVNASARESIYAAENISEFKSSVNKALIKVGYELIV